MLKFISYSSLAISLNAGLLALFYGLLANSVVIPRVLVVALGTFALYNLVQLVPLLRKSPLSERNKWIYANKKILWSMTAFALICSAGLSLLLTLKDWVNFGHLFVLTLLYENVLGNRPLRAMPYIKPFFISYVWAMCCGLPPLYDSMEAEFAWMVLESFLFILSLCLLFDIRDMKEDAEQGIKTFAALLGPAMTKFISAFFFWSGMILLITNASIPFGTIWPLGAAYFIILIKIKPSAGEYLYLYGVDGLIGAKLALVLAAGL